MTTQQNLAKTQKENMIYNFWAITDGAISIPLSIFIVPELSALGASYSSTISSFFCIEPPQKVFHLYMDFVE